MSFHKDFIWGAGTASYQIEGAWNEDGKGLSIWDTFCQREGTIKNGDTGKVACDHYHRYREDVAIMQELGLQSYRFSVSWPRIMPEGIGRINQKGIDFYSALIDALLENGIEPVITLYHWDLPEALQQKGGWLNRECSDWFAEYAGVLAKHFSDRVTKFITFNEPFSFVAGGYGNGNFAPGYKVSPQQMLTVAHNVLLAHGKAVCVLRKFASQPLEIGFTANFDSFYPMEETRSADIAAARAMQFGISGPVMRWLARPNWWLDPIVFGKYPELTPEQAQLLPAGYEADMAMISTPVDFLGFNHYQGTHVAVDAAGKPITPPYTPGFPSNAAGAPITPQALKWLVKFLDERYHMPLYVTENGMPCHDAVSLDGKVHDPNRQDYFHRYLQKLEEAIDEGADVRGYYVWSLLDNFEWGQGYSRRYGLVYVDFTTQKRTVKDSGWWYADVIRTNGENI